MRRPPPVSLLSPLLGHWGLAIESAAKRSLVIHHLREGEAIRRLTLAAPGRFTAAAGRCRIGPRDFFASCQIGSGRVLLVADADLLHDSMWTGPTLRGGERHARLADNPIVVAGWLDRLAGLQRRQLGDGVRHGDVSSHGREA